MPLHIPVLLDESIQFLFTNPKGIYADLTTGEGGHSLALAQKLDKEGKLFCFDRDSQIQNLAKEYLKDFSNIAFILSNFSQISVQLGKNKIEAGQVSGILADLGLSMFHYKESEKGFSFLQNHPLDMSLDGAKPNAYDIVNTFSKEEIADILFKYGEEHQSRKIAHFIERARKIKKIENTKELAQIIAKAKGFSKRGFHPATKSFQALRIYINKELDNLLTMIKQSLNLLAVGGRLVLITYHSLEDRMVKQFFKKQALESCFKLLTKKAIKASPQEIALNPSARSARLRVLQKEEQNKEV